MKQHVIIILLHAVFVMSGLSIVSAQQGTGLMPEHVVHTPKIANAYKMVIGNDTIPVYTEAIEKSWIDPNYVSQARLTKQEQSQLTMRSTQNVCDSIGMKKCPCEILGNISYSEIPDEVDILVECGELINVHTCVTALGPGLMIFPLNNGVTDLSTNTVIIDDDIDAINPLLGAGSYAFWSTDGNGCTDTLIVNIIQDCDDECDQMGLDICMPCDSVNNWVPSSYPDSVTYYVDCGDSTTVHGCVTANDPSLITWPLETGIIDVATGDTILFGVASIAPNLPAGEYLKYARDPVLGCETSVYILIEEDCCEQYDMYICPPDGSKQDSLVYEVDCVTGLLDTLHLILTADSVNWPGGTLTWDIEPLNGSVALPGPWPWLHTNVAPGRYRFTVTHDQTGCTAEQLVVINPCDTTGNSPCDSLDFSVSIIAQDTCSTDVASFSWQTNADEVRLNGFAVTSPLIGLSHGSYPLQVLLGQCDTTITVVIEEIITPDCDTTSGNNCGLFVSLQQMLPDNCEDSTGVLVIATNADSVLWQNGATSTTIADLSAGEWNVQLFKDSCVVDTSFTVTATSIGCGGNGTTSCDSIQFQLLENCDGSADVMFIADNSVTFSWSDGGTGHTRTIQAGWWQVVATDSVNNCSAFYYFEVEESFIAEVHTVDPLCDNGSTGTIDVFTNRNDALITINNDVVATDGHFFGTDYDPGTYNITVETSNGCFIDTVVVINPGDSLGFSYTVTTTICGDATGSIQYNAVPGSTYEFYGETNTTGLFEGLTDAVYDGATITTPNGCVLSTPQFQVFCSGIVTLFPNPIQEGQELIITVTDYPEEWLTTPETVTIEIWNTVGSQVTNQQVTLTESTQQFTIPTNGWQQTGIYFVRVYSEKGLIDRGNKLIVD